MSSRSGPRMTAKRRTGRKPSLMTRTVSSDVVILAEGQEPAIASVGVLDGHLAQPPQRVAEHGSLDARRGAGPDPVKENTT